MPKVQEQRTSTSSSLHSALTESQCNKCGAQLGWNPQFNDIFCVISPGESELTSNN
jgi:hypothetical protein